MPENAPQPPAQINLKDPNLAALLAWLVPGAGHLYQGRLAKAAIFFVCIFGTFVYGMFLGGGRVVYAQWDPPKYRRWSYLCQIGVGLPALPALVAARQNNFLGTQYYVPPDPRPLNGQMSELDKLNLDYNRRWELGTTFTMIAGLLNVLAIYDAWGGPAFPAPPEQRRRKRKDKSDEDARDGPGETEPTSSEKTTV